MAHHHRSRRAGITRAMFALWLLSPAAGAEIYRYQDDQGNWVFTDRPPPSLIESQTRQGSNGPPVSGYDGAQTPAQRRGPPAALSTPARRPPPDFATTEPRPPTLHLRPPAPAPANPASATTATVPVPPPPIAPEPAPKIDLKHDIEARLLQRFGPVSAVETSSLAVVTLNSELGSGSGFFISGDGLLLTNRHVVRPPDDWAAEEWAALDALKQKLDALEKRLALPRDRYSDPNDYDRGQRLLRERGREYRQAKRELEMKRNAALLQRAFEIQLKDGETLTAELVEVSAEHDLALLRVTGYRTPYLRPLLGIRPRQTQPVYAIGSPLGIKDTVTAGTYTGERDGMLVTDARIMPGSSGGPLVTEAGAVIGVNTWKATLGPDAKQRGFGVSIPIEIAFREFPDVQAWWEGAPMSQAPR